MLKQFLRALPELLFTPKSLEKLREAVESSSEAQQLALLRDSINVLPEPNRVLAHRLMALLSELSESEGNRMTAENLAIVFAPVVMWRAEGVGVVTGLEEAQQAMLLLVQSWSLLYRSVSKSDSLSQLQRGAKSAKSKLRSSNEVPAGAKMRKQAALTASTEMRPPTDKAPMYGANARIWPRLAHRKRARARARARADRRREPKQAARLCKRTSRKRCHLRQSISTTTAAAAAKTHPCPLSTWTSLLRAAAAVAALVATTTTTTTTTTWTWSSSRARSKTCPTCAFHAQSAAMWICWCVAYVLVSRFFAK